MLTVLANFDLQTCDPGCSTASASGQGPSTTNQDAAAISAVPVSARRQTKVHAAQALQVSTANIQEVRINRVGCLLTKLVRQARSLSRRLVAPPS
jgi:hypothetical protein